MRVLGAVDHRVEAGVEDEEGQRQGHAVEPELAQDADTIGDDADEETEQDVEAVLGDAHLQPVLLQTPAGLRPLDHRAHADCAYLGPDLV